MERFIHLRIALQTCAPAHDTCKLVQAEDEGGMGIASFCRGSDRDGVGVPGANRLLPEPRVARDCETERSVSKKCEYCQDHSSNPSHEFPPSQQKKVAVERYEKAEGRPYSKIPSIFDHTARNSSIIRSNYHSSI
jgi:hypothetical protein